MAPTPSKQAALVSDVLAEYGEVAKRHLVSVLDAARERDPVYDLASDYPLRGGRALRASLCIASACAFGAPIESAVESAVSLELLHNAFLVHDDIEDSSLERRGAPTLHVLHGVPTAVNVGDALVALSMQRLAQNQHVLGPRVAHAVFHETERMARESVEGQAIELRWRRDNALDVGPDDYLKMILKKTCWYTTIYPSRVGALIGKRRSLGSGSFVRFGFFLGAAFQVQDDVLNLIGDHERYGKELCGDLVEGKRSLVLIHLLARLDERERLRVRDLLASDSASVGAGDSSWILGEMKRRGSLGYARKFSHGLAGAAAHEFKLAFVGARPGRDRDFIEALPHWMLERA